VLLRIGMAWIMNSPSSVTIMTSSSRFPRTVWPCQKESDRVIAEFDPGDAVFSGVKHVIIGNVVLSRRRENLHLISVIRLIHPDKTFPANGHRDWFPTPRTGGAEFLARLHCELSSASWGLEPAPLVRNPWVT